MVRTYVVPLRLAPRRAFAPVPGERSPRSRLQTADPTPPRGVRGFTLIELIVVVAIIGILATIAVPAMRTAPLRARESALREDLYALRSCVDQFHADRSRYPASLDELVALGYLRSVPTDPITNSKDSWVLTFEEVTEQQDERQQQAGQGIIDVHSGSDKVALDGTKYADW
jgi:general secretion pathway protein G